MSDEVKTANAKGTELERAVMTIEQVIARVSPLINEKSFVIENRKIVTVNGVRHEIDIFVTIDLGSGYKSIFIFECKNWSDAVGKDEIIIFSEKIKALGAQHGFFIAKSFTSFAKAQAALDSRVSLLTATEHDPTSTPRPLQFHVIVQELKHIRLRFNKRGQKAGTTSPIDPKAAKATLSGTSIDLGEYMKQWATEASTQELNRSPSHTMADGTHDRSFVVTKQFDPNELMIDGIDIESAELAVQLEARIVRPPIVSHFEVSTRGRFIAFAPVSVSEAEVEMGLVEVGQPPEPNKQ